MVVVGGRDSSNTIQLVRVCQPHCPTYHVVTAAELQPAWFEGLHEVGVVAGASTREVDIQAVIGALEGMGAPVPESATATVPA